MHFCACRIHWKVYLRVGRRLGSYGLISEQPLIGSTFRELCISSVLWVLEILCFLYWYRFYRIDHSTLWWSKLVNVISGVPQGSVWASYCSFRTLRCFFPSWIICWSVMPMIPLWELLCHPHALELQLQSPWSVRDLGRVSEWCDLWGMKLNASKTKTIIVSRSRTMHPESPPLTIGGTVLKESDDLVIFGMTFDSKLTFEKHLRLVSRAASHLVSWGSPGERSMIDHFLRDASAVLSCQFWSTVLQCGARLQIHSWNCWTVLSVVPVFLTRSVFECDLVHRRSAAVLCMLYEIRCNPMRPLFTHSTCAVCAGAGYTYPAVFPFSYFILWVGVVGLGSSDW